MPSNQQSKWRATRRNESQAERPQSTRFTLRIRKAVRSDRKEWQRLRCELWPDCRGARAELEMQELLSNPRKFAVLVLDRGNETLGGFIEIALRDGVDGAARETTAFVEGWLVEADLRAKGWGRKLIRAAEEWAARRGMVELASDTELENHHGIAAHLAVGFRETFRTVQFLKKIRSHA